MRLIRSVCRSANGGLPHWFQWYQDTEVSSACLHQGLYEAFNCVACNYQSYATSASASAVPKVLEDRKPPKRISKIERRAMVENYVNKYREKMEGKFPSPSDTMKDVGGSYYVIRQILQEMKYRSSQSSMASNDTSLEKNTRKKNERICSSEESEDIMDIYLEKSAIKKCNVSICNSEEQSMHTNDTSLEKSTMKDDKISAKIEEVTQTRELRKHNGKILKDIESFSSTIFQSKQGKKSSVSDETDEPKDIGAQRHPIDELESSRNVDDDTEVKHEILGDHTQSIDARPQETMEISRRGLQGPPEDAEAEKKSSLWKNLKSLANGIFSIWKRS